MPFSIKQSACLLAVSAVIALPAAAPAHAYTPPIGSDKGSVVAIDGSPRADGIIAVLIALVRSSDGP